MSKQAWKRQLQSAFLMTLVLMILTGLIYPGVVTVVAQLLFPGQANGSLIARQGTVVGSTLIGQGFSQPWYFHSRPSAAGNGYDPMASGGTNKGPTDRKLADTSIAQAVDSLVKNDGAVRGQIPADLVTSSASGLDPHISPASAALQVNRISQTRGVDSTQIRALVAQYVEGRQWGLLGEPRVNVLKLNLALDQRFPRH